MEKFWKWICANSTPPVPTSWVPIILPQLALGKSFVIFSEFQALRVQRLYLFGLIFPER